MVIQVPKTPKSAMNKDRPISALLRSQVEHCREAEAQFIRRIKTEQQAAEYIRHVTLLLQTEAAKRR